MILYDPATVEIDPDRSVRQVAVPAKDTAVEKLGRPIYANTIMLGALTRAAATDLDKDNMIATLLEIIPKFKAQNQAAFELGYGMLAT